MTARRDDTPPKSHFDTSTGRTSYRVGRSPWENPGAWLQIYGMGRNVWAAWAMRHGLLDEFFDRAITTDDFGDEASLALAGLLPRRVDVEGMP